jgi:peptidylprolyl isomerase
MSRHGEGKVARRVAVATATAGVALAATAAAVWPGVPAGAASMAAGKKHHPSRIPAVEHATDLSAEPIIRAGKGKPPTKVLVKNLVVGTGATVAGTDDDVTVKYVGANYKSGQDFTSATWTSGQPATFTLRGVVQGFAEGLVGMKVGGRREVVIPPKYGYGDHHEGPIVANETLVFVVDLESVSAVSSTGS